jgi:phenylalanyl-tRNA synthetase alpha chain
VCLGIYNLTTSVEAKLKRKLYLVPNHPIEIVKRLVYKATGCPVVVEDLSSEVSVADNFDLLRIPLDHPSRRVTDTYYLNEDTVIRTHTTAHLPILARLHSDYMVAGDVARKDTINSAHYLVFCQVDAYRETDTPHEDLLRDLSAIIETLFPGREYRFSPDYFPFTISSVEAELKFGDRWIEILGGGTVHPDIMEAIGKSDKTAYAYGLGLDRLAMILFEIPDIRLLWSGDERFLAQFSSGEIVKYKPYSDQPPCKKDMALWIHNSDEVTDSEWSGYNDMCEGIISIIYTEVT